MKTTIYLGALKDKAQALRWAKAIRAKYGRNQKQSDTALLLERNWKFVAARPELANEIEQLACD